MKKFLLKLFRFILPILLIAYPLDFFISYNLKKSNASNGELQVWNDIYTGEAGCDVAVYGSSRAALHINPQILEDSLHRRAYNFGFIGYSFWMEYLRHSEFFKYNAKPKQIIVSLDVFSLTNKLNVLYEADQFLPFLLANGDMQSYASKSAGYSVNGYTKFDCYLPLLRYVGKRESLLNSVENMFNPEIEVYKMRKRGFVPRDKDWDDEFDEKLYPRKQIRVTFEPKAVELFEKFINECKNSNIDLIFVYTPEYIERREWVTNRNDVINLYKEFAAKYNLVFLDYSDDEMSYDKKFFFDSFHLNAKGADVFTTKLAAELKELGH